MALFLYCFFFKQKTAYEMRISDWSSDVCSSDLGALIAAGLIALALWTAYNFAYGNGYNAANVRAEKIIGEFARAEAEAQGRARAAERRQAEAIADITEQYERDRADAQAAANRLAIGRAHV